MSIDHPRRIFRSSRRARRGDRSGLGRTLLVGLVGAAGVSALVLLGLSSTMLGRNPPGPDTIAARAAEVAVIDGDTLRLAGTVVRLTGLTVPARGQACSAGPDCGSQASAMLASLVRDRDTQCLVTGHDSQGRPKAQCSAGDRDLNAAMVAAGWARADGAALAAAEQDARSRRRGLWLND